MRRITTVFAVLCILFSGSIPIYAYDDSFFDHSILKETVRNGWSSDGQMYYKNGRYVTGQQKIDGYYYYFDEKTGKMVHGWKYLSDKKITVWYGQETGHMLFGEYRINMKWYYLDDVTGGITYGWKQIIHNGKKITVYYDKNGWKVFGKQTIDGKKYEFSTSTGALIKGDNPFNSSSSGLKGWNSGKDMYYENNAPVTGAKKIDGFWYYFDKTGRKTVSSFVDISSNYRVYYDSEGHLVFGTKKIGGYWYKFENNNGNMIRNRFVDINNDYRVYYNSEGHLVFGTKKIGGYWYKFENNNGNMIRSQFVDISNNYRVYYDADGHLVLGTKKIGNYWYNFQTNNGNMIHDQFVDIREGYRVYYDSKGHLVFGKQTIDGKTYEFDNRTGALIKDDASSSSTSLSSSDGSSEMEDGWSDDGQMYYKDGHYVTGQRQINGYYYYFDEKTGKMVHGWKYIESQDKTVWYGQETGRMLYGEHRINGHYYYLNKTTGAVTYGWKTLNGKKLYYDPNGWKAMGMQLIDGKWHEFDASTGEYIGEAKGWKWESSKLVFYNSKGALCKGTVKINSVSYTFDSSTGAVKNKNAVSTIYDAHTNAIINAHRYDFNSSNMESILKSYGGYDEYIKSLGGVFTKYYAKDKYNVTTVAQFQEVAKYVWGLLTIYGVDYYNAVYGKDSCWGGAYPADDAFYTSSSVIAAIKGKTNPENAFIDDVLAGKTAAGMQVNCSQGITYILRKAGLISDDAPTVESEFYYYKTGDSKEWTHYYRNNGAQIITDANNFKVGDIIAFFNGTSYKHVVMVMYVNKSAGTYTLYDSGHILTTNRKGIRTLKIGTSPTTMFSSYNSWVAMRLPLNLKE